MLCINRERLYETGELLERVVIQADTTPDTMPTTGIGVDALPNSVTIAPASILYVLGTSKRYIFGQDETWHEWSN